MKKLLLLATLLCLSTIFFSCEKDSKLERYILEKPMEGVSNEVKAIEEND